MASSEDILLTFKTETGEVTKSLADIQKGVEGVDNEIKKTAKNTSKIGKGLRAAGKLGATGFKALGTAIAATGIGALIGLIAGLTAKMAENKKIAEAFEVVVSAVGAAFNILVERIEPLAGVIIDAFSNPVESIKSLGNAIKNNIQTRLEGLLEFIPALGKSIKLLFAGEWEEAGKVAADAAGKVVLGVEDISDKVAVAAEAVKEFATEFKEEATKAVVASSQLTQETQKLRDQQRDLNVEYAEARAEIEQLKQKRDDERLSIEQRVAAAQRASDLDQEFAQRREAIANAEVALIQREINVQGDSIERQERLAEARIAAAEAAESSAAVQTELMTSIFGLEQEALAIEDEKIAKAKEVADLEIQLALEAKARKDKEAAEDQARNEALFNSRIQFATQALGALSALNDAFEGNTDKQRERAFKRNKAIGISTAIINTAGAIMGAISPSAGGLGIPAGLPGAALAAATGVAQIATIAKSKFNGGASTGGTSTPAIGNSREAQTPQPSPQLDLGFLGAGSGQSGFRSYVIASEVSNSQQANQRINDQASLVG